MSRRVLFFGTGKFYRNRKKKIERISINEKLIGFVDNRSDEIKTFEGKTVYSPQMLINLDFDFVVLMSGDYLSMRKQLIELGIPDCKILLWEEYLVLHTEYEMESYTVKNEAADGKYKILIVTVGIGLNGGSMAIVYAAIELSRLGHCVTLLAPVCDDDIRIRLFSAGVNLECNPLVQFLNSEQLKKYTNKDVALVNVYQNIRVACELSKFMPTLWWLHENSDRYCNIYHSFRELFYQYDNVKMFSKICIAAVTNWAANVFKDVYSRSVDIILPLGIPDEALDCHGKNVSKKITFAIIGEVQERKGQDIFLRAIEMLNIEEHYITQFLLIGKCNQNEPFSKYVYDSVEKMPNVRLLGEVTRDSLKEIFTSIDVIVCASREETLSIAVIEGMMNRKICITTDATGISEFMQDGNDGFIIPSDDAGALSEKMHYIIKHLPQMEKMRQAARQVYEENFTMQALGKRLETALLKTMRGYNH